uniref:Uncharacterized protein n=1 Tax=Heliothis virescens TaxID=7102 RepID=A0A2A4ITW3_HELVI
MDYHTSGKYPWRHAFRRHLARNPDLWTADTADIKQEPTKSDVRSDLTDLPDVRSELPDVIQDSVKSDIRFSARTLDGVVRENLQRVMRKRAWSGCSDTSYDSDESLQPVEKEFQQFIDEVNKKWLHFRPASPEPPEEAPPPPAQLRVSAQTPLAVELRGAAPAFTTTEFTLAALRPATPPHHASDHACANHATGMGTLHILSYIIGQFL